MLSMGFAPRTGGAIVGALPPAVLSSTVDGDTWRSALGLAETFFAKVYACEGLSPRFGPCIAALRRHLDDATARIARLG